MPLIRLAPSKALPANSSIKYWNRVRREVLKTLHQSWMNHDGRISTRTLTERVLNSLHPPAVMRSDVMTAVKYLARIGLITCGGTNEAHWWLPMPTVISSWNSVENVLNHSQDEK